MRAAYLFLFALQDAVAKLTEDMSQAGFPVIRLMGMYQLPSVPSPVFLFGVTEIVGKPLNRQFAGLRKIKQVWPGPNTPVSGVLQCAMDGVHLPQKS
jgi:hypothetical protein